MPVDPDFWDKFAIESEVPAEVRKFIARGKYNGSMGQTMGYYAYGYARAFEQLMMVAIGKWPNADYLRFPLLFLIRHSAELHLKDVIQEYSLRNRTAYASSNQHNLLTLWNEAIKQIQVWGVPPRDEWSLHVGKLINHIHDFDPNGQRFRYPEDNKGKPFDSTRAELEELAKAHLNIMLWCESAGDMLQAEDRG